VSSSPDADQITESTEQYGQTAVRPPPGSTAQFHTSDGGYVRRQ